PMATLKLRGLFSASFCRTENFSFQPSSPQFQLSPGSRIYKVFRFSTVCRVTVHGAVACRFMLSQALNLVRNVRDVGRKILFANLSMLSARQVAPGWVKN